MITQATMNQIRNFLRTFSLKKGSSIARLLPFFIFITACESDWARYGKVEHGSSVNNNYFIFSVSEEYLRAHKNSVPDKKNPKLTEAENKLLLKLLKQKNYCVMKNGDIAFRITSKQEKVYDMTFAHLIEEHYNARPITPVTYYGRCFNEKALKKQIRREFESIKKEVTN